MYLPGNPADARMSDEGFEETLIENISFSNITIDRNYYAPIRIEIAEHNLCRGIQNIYFSGIRSYSAQMPVIMGRKDCHAKNIHFNDCRFTQIPYEDIPTKFAVRLKNLNRPLNPPRFSCVDNLFINATFFSVL
jgi:hypothetical protein